MNDWFAVSGWLSHWSPSLTLVSVLRTSSCLVLSSLHIWSIIFQLSWLIAYTLGKSPTGIRNSKQITTLSKSSSIRASRLHGALTGDLPPVDHIQP